MFSGESNHNLDSKHRVFVPRRFQDVLGRNPEGSLSVILTRGFENCLFLFSDEGFERVLTRLQTQPFGGAKLRRMQRMFFANTHRSQLDASGRLVLPEKLRTVASIEKEVVMVGVAERAEIWSKAEWESFEANSADAFDELDEVLMGSPGGSTTEPSGGAG